MTFQNRTPKFIDPKDAISITKENGTKVGYYLFDTFEIHTNLIPEMSVQDWHSHQDIEEIIVVNKGSLLLEWIENEIKQRKVNCGEIIRMNNSIHRISNIENSSAECTIFRFVAPEKDQSEVIKNDKRIYTDEEIGNLLLFET